MSSRYVLGDDTYLAWGNEVTPYTKVATPNPLGLLGDTFTVPNVNPLQAEPASGTTRGPHIYSRPEREWAFDVTCGIQEAEKLPFHAAIGSVASQVINATDPDEYTEYLYTEEDCLPTITVAAGFQDTALDMEQRFIGTKADLQLTARKGQKLMSGFKFMAAVSEYEEAPTFAAPNIPKTNPFMFHMVGDATLYEEGTSTVIKAVDSVDSVDFQWQNGLTANHHGKGRDAHSISEEGGGDRYDMKLGVTVKDLDLWKRVFDDDDRFDLEVPFVREAISGTDVDAVIVRLKGCSLADAPFPGGQAGRMQHDLEIMPLTTELEVRVPA